MRLSPPDYLKLIIYIYNIRNKWCFNLPILITHFNNIVYIIHNYNILLFFIVVEGERITAMKMFDYFLFEVYKLFITFTSQNPNYNLRKGTFNCLNEFFYSLV